MKILTSIQKRLCNTLQDGIPVCSRPFAEIAKELGIEENQVLEEIVGLKSSGIIRRFRAMINHRTLGKTGTLVTAHVARGEVNNVAQAVNSLDGVSHNYLREHYYNLWFTLQGTTQTQIDITLSKLSERFGIEFHSLPVIRTFKLNVRFNLESEEQDFISKAERPKDSNIELSSDEKLILSKLQGELEITSEPFRFLYSEELEAEKTLSIIKGLIAKGVIRRIAAVLDYLKLGFVANVLFVCEVTQQNIIEAGESLAKFRIVSHCYQRKTFPDWSYNLFGMMHGKSMGQIQRVIDKFKKAHDIESFELLPTAAEFKKHPVKYSFD